MVINFPKRENYKDKLNTFNFKAIKIRIELKHLSPQWIPMAPIKVRHCLSSSPT